jgi:1-acyl-sn-glycerol-3-phosphate acyltransferase
MKKTSDANALALRLIAVVRDLVHELHEPRARSGRDCQCRDRDRAYGQCDIKRIRTRLPVSIMGEADTVGDLLAALQQAAAQSGIPEIDFISAPEIGSQAAGYLVKKELAGSFFAGPLLRRLGVLFVDRYDLAGGIADTAVATALTRQGRLLVMFPEGTFTRQAGLLEFFTGAFKIASEAGLPVYPGVLRGTRSILRGDQWFPRWGSVDIEILDPL